MQPSITGSVSYLSLNSQPFLRAWWRGGPLGLFNSCMDGWTNKQKQKLNLPDPLPLIFEPRRLSKVCLKLLPAGKLQVSVKKHQYLDGYIFFPNAHNILHPDNIYGLSSEITNWICHAAHRENVWRMVPHYSHRKVIPHAPNLYRRDSENTNGPGRNNVPAVTPSFSCIYHLDRVICIWIEPALKFRVYVLPVINKEVPERRLGCRSWSSFSEGCLSRWPHGSEVTHLWCPWGQGHIPCGGQGLHLVRCKGRITELPSSHFSLHSLPLPSFHPCSLTFLVSF